MTEAAKVEPFAVQRRRQGRREEARIQTAFVALLAEYLDPACTFWTSIENKPRSPVSTIFQRARGVKSGLADVVVIQRTWKSATSAPWEAEKLAAVGDDAAGVDVAACAAHSQWS